MTTAHLWAGLVGAGRTVVSFVASAYAIFALPVATAVEGAYLLLAVSTSKTWLTKTCSIDTHALPGTVHGAGPIAAVGAGKTRRAVAKHLRLDAPAIAAARFAIRPLGAHSVATVVTLVLQITHTHTVLALAVAAALILTRPLEAQNTSVTRIALAVLAHGGGCAVAVASAYLSLVIWTRRNATRRARPAHVAVAHIIALVLIQ